MSEDRTGLVLKPKRAKHNLAHFGVVARVDKAHATPATVTIDRARKLVTIRRTRARRAWSIPLATLVEVGMGRLMRQEAEMLMARRA